MMNGTFFVSHGSPRLPVKKDNTPSLQFLQEWRQRALPQKPKAILVISAHWDTEEPAVSGVDGPLGTMYDFSHDLLHGTKTMKYPAPGSPELANRVKELLVAAGYQKTQVDKERGLDHGAWIPLRLMYPDADIPVCELSIQLNKDGTHHFNMGKALAPLKEEGVLILGSGSATSNPETVNTEHPEAIPEWALEFHNWLKEALINGRYDDVTQYEQKAPHVSVAHPTHEHFLPLIVAMGSSAGDNSKAELLHYSWDDATMCNSSYKFITNYSSTAF